MDALDSAMAGFDDLKQPDARVPPIGNPSKALPGILALNSHEKQRMRDAQKYRSLLLRLQTAAGGELASEWHVNLTFSRHELLFILSQAGHAANETARKRECVEFLV